jgi:hypothetical protein
MPRVFAKGQAPARWGFYRLDRMSVKFRPAPGVRGAR